MCDFSVITHVSVVLAGVFTKGVHVCKNCLPLKIVIDQSHEFINLFLFEMFLQRLIIGENGCHSTRPIRQRIIFSCWNKHLVMYFISFLCILLMEHTIKNIVRYTHCGIIFIRESGRVNSGIFLHDLIQKMLRIRIYLVTSLNVPRNYYFHFLLS